MLQDNWFGLGFAIVWTVAGLTYVAMLTMSVNRRLRDLERDMRWIKLGLERDGLASPSDQTFIDSDSKESTDDGSSYH